MLRKSRRERESKDYILHSCQLFTEPFVLNIASWTPGKCAGGVRLNRRVRHKVIAGTILGQEPLLCAHHLRYVQRVACPHLGLVERCSNLFCIMECAFSWFKHYSSNSFLDMVVYSPAHFCLLTSISTTIRIWCVLDPLLLLYVPFKPPKAA